MRQIAFIIAGFALFLGATYSALAQNNQDKPFAPIDAYTLGDLNGQDGWSDYWNSLVVQDYVTASSTQALTAHDEFGGSAFKPLSKNFYASGVAEIKFRVFSNQFSDDQGIIGLFKENTQEIVALVRFTNNSNGFTNTLLASESAALEPKIMGEIKQKTWHTIKLEWRASESSVRARVDEGEWTPWFSTGTGWKEEDTLGVTLSLPAVNDYGGFYLGDLSLSIPPAEEAMLISPMEPIVHIIQEVASSTAGFLGDVLDAILSPFASATETPAVSPEAASSDSVIQESPSVQENVVDLSPESRTDTSAPQDSLETNQTPGVEGVQESVSTQPAEENTISAPVTEEVVSTTTENF